MISYINVNLANVPTETWNARCYKAVRVQNNSGKDMKIIYLFIYCSFLKKRL